MHMHACVCVCACACVCVRACVCACVCDPENVVAKIFKRLDRMLKPKRGDQSPYRSVVDHIK